MKAPEKATLNGAAAILRMLELHGVRHVFGLPGETTIGWYREWGASSGVEYVLTRDERTAAFAAEAYAKVTGRPGVLEAPSPGVTHCTPGIAEAFLSSVPVIFFSSDIPANQDKRHALTGLDQTALYESIVKESFHPTDVRDIPFLMRRAFRVATSGRPAPVHIRVPMDVFEQEAQLEDLYADADHGRFPAHRPVADHAKLAATVEMLAAAQRPVMVCGQGALISGASETALEFAELLQIPVATTTPGKGTIAEDHPLALRVVGARGGMEHSNAYVREADAVFLIGTNTDSAGTDHWKLYGDPFAKDFAHLDIAEAHVGNSFPARIAMVGDARASLEHMVRLARSTPDVQRREPVDLNPLKRAALDKVFGANIPMPEGTVSPVRLAEALDRLLPDDAVVTAEPGVAAIYPSALMTVRRAGRRYLTNYSMGALGYSVPAAIGAAHAADTPVVAITGDGSIGFVLGDFETIRRSGRNVTVILTRNDSFGWIRGEAILLENVDEPWSTDFGAVDYIKVAEGFGFRTARIDSEDDIAPALSAAISNPGADFIEMMVPTQDKVVPFVPSWVAVARERNIPHFS